jgi:hypothetical protein
MITLAIVSYIGSAKFGGLDYIHYGWDLVVVAVIGLVFFLWGVKSGWRTPSIEAERREAAAHPDDLQIPPDEEAAERVTGR